MLSRPTRKQDNDSARGGAWWIFVFFIGIAAFLLSDGILEQKGNSLVVGSSLIGGHMIITISISSSNNKDIVKKIRKDTKNKNKKNDTKDEKHQHQEEEEEAEEKQYCCY